LGFLIKPPLREPYNRGVTILGHGQQKEHPCTMRDALSAVYRFCFQSVAGALLLIGGFFPNPNMCA